MTTLSHLTALEREQLRYIVERVPEWPEGHGSIWVTSVGWIVGSDPHKGRYQFKNMDRDHPTWPTYSPSFTRAQYDAMKAEIEAEKLSGYPYKAPDVDAPAIDYRAHCEALAGLLEVAACPDNCIDGVHYDDGEILQCQFCYERTEALTRWKEDSK